MIVDNVGEIEWGGSIALPRYSAKLTSRNNSDEFLLVENMARKIIATKYAFDGTKKWSVGYQPQELGGVKSVYLEDAVAGANDDWWAYGFISWYEYPHLCDADTRYFAVRLSREGKILADTEWTYDIEKNDDLEGDFAVRVSSGSQIIVITNEETPDDDDDNNDDESPDGANASDDDDDNDEGCGCSLF